MELIDLIYPGNRIISIVGTYKNAGKTVTLNEIIRQAEDRAIPLGLISTGRDGEKRDLVTESVKPPVYVPRGSIIATVENAIKPEYVGIEIFSVTDYRTPMGRVIIGRAKDDGLVEISGPYSSRTIREMCQEMIGLGAELVLLDGSLDRRASAAPFVSDGTIIATGASLSRSQELVIEKTLHIIENYSIQVIEEDIIRDLARKFIDDGKTAIIEDDLAYTIIESETSLEIGDLILEQLTEDSRYLVLKGSASSSTLDYIIKNLEKPLKIIIKDGTRIFLSERQIKLYRKMGLELRVLDDINIIAITINPYSPQGYYFDALDFLENMRKAIPHIPVFDVMQGGY